MLYGDKKKYFNHLHFLYLYFFSIFMQNDRAIINLGNVTVDFCGSIEECTIVITYAAIMVDDTVQNGSVYWVSAGAEYHNSNEVWVGQASFESITDELVRRR